jgi:hypothetical protein
VVIVAGCLLITQHNPSLAAGNDTTPSTKKPVAVKPEDNTMTRTAFFDLKLIKCPKDTGNIINDGMRDRLERIPYLHLVSDEEIKGTGIEDSHDCHEKECAVKFSKMLDCKKVIIGVITKEIHAKREQMGKEGEFKYIYEVKPYDLFIITIEVIDISNGMIAVSLEEKAKKNEINARLDAMAATLSDYFKPIPPPEPPKLTPWISLSPSCIVPHGRFRTLIGAAGGIRLDAGLKHIGVPNTYLMVSGGYYFVSQKKGSIKNYQSGQLSVMGGYSFSLPKGFSITPVIGLGCQFHFIKDFQYTLPYIVGHTIRTAYYDPLITIRCEGAYNVYKDLYVTLTPGYSIFFEKGLTGNYVNIDIGVKYEFDIDKGAGHEE